MGTMRNLATGTCAALVAGFWTTGAWAAEPFTPRGYCHQTGGAVLETGNRHHYICCYAARQYCLAMDTRSRTSVRVLFTDDFNADMDAMLVTNKQRR